MSQILKCYKKAVYGSQGLKYFLADFLQNQPASSLLYVIQYFLAISTLSSYNVVYLVVCLDLSPPSSQIFKQFILFLTAREVLQGFACFGSSLLIVPFILHLILVCLPLLGQRKSCFQKTILHSLSEVSLSIWLSLVFALMPLYQGLTLHWSLSSLSLGGDCVLKLIEPVEYEKVAAWFHQLCHPEHPLPKLFCFLNIALLGLTHLPAWSSLPYQHHTIWSLDIQFINMVKVFCLTHGILSSMTWRLTLGLSHYNIYQMLRWHFFLLFLCTGVLPACMPI